MRIRWVCAVQCWHTTITTTIAAIVVAGVYLFPQLADFTLHSLHSSISHNWKLACGNMAKICVRHRDTETPCPRAENENANDDDDGVSQVENSLERTFAINIFRLCKVHRAKLNVGIGYILDSQLCALQVHRQVEHFFLLIGFYLVRVNELQARTTKLHTLSSRHLAIADGTVATTPPW